MTQSTAPQLVEHFDHFVVPVDDLVQAEDFYINILGARLAYNARGPMRYGLNVHQTIHGMRPHTFFVAAGKRIVAVFIGTSNGSTRLRLAAPAVSNSVTRRRSADQCARPSAISAFSVSCATASESCGSRESNSLASLHAFRSRI